MARLSNLLEHTYYIPDRDFVTDEANNTPKHDTAIEDKPEYYFEMEYYLTEKGNTTDV